MSEMSESGTVWSITINNPSEEDRATLKAWPAYVKELVGQDEVGENGTLHFQGLVKCKYTTKFSAIKKWLTRAHIEKARNVKALMNYVQKTETAVEGTQMKLTESVSESKEYITPSKFPRLVVKMAKEYMTKHDWKIHGEWFDMYEAYEYVSFRNAVVNATIREMIKEGWHIELLAVNPQVMKALNMYFLELWEETNHCYSYPFEDMMKTGLRPKRSEML